MLWSRLRQLRRELAAVDVGLYLLARLIGKLTGARVELRKYYFFAQPVADEPLLPPHRGHAIRVQLADRHHPVVSSFPRPRQVIERRFDDRALCFVATKAESFVGFLWLQAPSYLEDEVRCRFTPLPSNQAVWDFDVHVEEPHRASLAFARLWDTANDYLRENGVRWSVSRISAFNPASLNSHRRLGAYPMSSACFISGRKWQLLLSGSPPYLHFSTGPHRIPEMRLRPPH